MTHLKTLNETGLHTVGWTTWNTCNQTHSQHQNFT